MNPRKFRIVEKEWLERRVVEDKTEDSGNAAERTSLKRRSQSNSKEGRPEKKPKWSSKGEEKENKKSQEEKNKEEKKKKKEEKKRVPLVDLLGEVSSDSKLDDEMVKAAEERLQDGFLVLEEILSTGDMDFDEREIEPEKKKESKEKELPEKKGEKPQKEKKEVQKKKRKLLEEKDSGVCLSSPQKYSPSRPRMVEGEVEGQGDTLKLQSPTPIPEYLPTPISDLIPAHRREEVLKPQNESLFGPPKSKSATTSATTSPDRKSEDRGSGKEGGVSPDCGSFNISTEKPCLDTNPSFSSPRDKHFTDCSNPGMDTAGG